MHRLNQTSCWQGCRLMIARNAFVAIHDTHFMHASLQIAAPSAVCHCIPASLLSRLCDSPFLPHLVMRGLVNGAAKVDVRASLCLWIIDVCAQTARSASTCRMLTPEHSMYTCARADCQVGLRIRSRLKLGAMRCSSLRRRGWGDLYFFYAV